MPVKIFRRKGSLIYSYRGTAAGRRLRGSTGTTDKIRAERIAAKKESEQWDGHLDGPKAVLTFAKASILYRASGKASDKRQIRYLEKIEDYWKDTLVKDMTAGAIRQSAIDIYPDAGGATRNRQVITPTQAVINHCADLEKCAPIRIKDRFAFDKKIKKPIMLEWIDTFCAHARPQPKALAIFMLATGCRISEARRLEWADIDFQNNSIMVQKTKSKKARLPHMPTRLLVALANLPRDDKPFGRSESRLRRHWDADVAATAKVVPGFERLTFHSCRHGFATTLLRKGIDVKTAATLGGWESVTLFMDTYAHAIQQPKLTNAIFENDTPVTQPVAEVKKINGLGE